MPVDARIALGVEPVKMPDFAQLAVQRSAVMNNMAEMAAKQRALNEQNTLAQLVQTPGYDPTNPEWRRKTAVSAPNLGAEFLKAQDAAAKAQIDAQAAARAEQEAQRQAALTELFQYDDFDGAEAAIDARVAAGALTAEQAAAVKSRMRASPDYATFAFNHARSMLTPEQMTEVTRTTQDLGGKKIVTATPTRAPVGTAPVTEATYDVTMTPDQIADNARMANTDRATSQRPFMSTNQEGAATFFSPDGKNIIATYPGVGKPSTAVEKSTADRQARVRAMDLAEGVIDKLLQPNSNVDKAKGGLPTEAALVWAYLWGKESDEGTALAALATESDKILKQIERFEGPQSDADTKSYKEAAGKLSDPKATPGQKRAAMQTLKEGFQREREWLAANPAKVGSVDKSGGGAAGLPADIQDLLKKYPG